MLLISYLLSLSALHFLMRQKHGKQKMSRKESSKEHTTNVTHFLSACPFSVEVEQ